MPNFVGATKGSTTERGYGWTDHIKPRRAAFAALPEWSACCICGRAMWKHATETLRDGRVRSTVHRQHNRARTAYLGFAHAMCNRKDGADEGRRRMVRRRMAVKRMAVKRMDDQMITSTRPSAVRHSRDW